MNSKYDLLIWLGAGSGDEPAQLIDSAKRVVLVDAQKTLCKALQLRFKSESNIQIVNQCISVHGGKVNWYQYNLEEFSATSKATALLNMFPGLKLQHSTEKDSMALLPFLLHHSPGVGKQALYLDCPAQNSDFVNLLLAQSEIQFESIYLSVSEQALYQDMKTEGEVSNALERHGYQKNTCDITDPDLPVLHFSLNTLWRPLEEAKKKMKILKNELLDVEKQLEQAKTESINFQMEFRTLMEELEQQKQLNKASCKLMLKMSMYISSFDNKTTRGSNSKQESS